MRCYSCLVLYFHGQTCNRSLSNKVISYQAVANKMQVELLPNEFKDVRRVDKMLISKVILLGKITITHEKEEFATVKGNICNILDETQNVCNIQGLR